MEVESPAKASDWTFSDRNDFTATWNRANVLNLMRGQDGADEYRSIRQRMDFYNWFDQIREAQGQDILWPAAAWIVAAQMASLENPARTAAMTLRRAIGLSFHTSAKLIAFGEAGNKAIFDDVFPRLKDVFMKGMQRQPLKAGAAAAWDRETLRHEQFDVVQPIYQRFAATDEELRQELADLAGGKGMMAIGGIAIGFALDFKGDIMSPRDRFNHGINVVTRFYKQFKQAIDGQRREQATKADPTGGGMLRVDSHEGLKPTGTSGL